MSDSDSGVSPFDALADEFVARHRRGERPSVNEYAEKYPELADDIRDLFPGLLLMEDMRPAAPEVNGPFHGAAARNGLDRLGDYRILREVGRGGMGVVYEAEQVSLGRHVALKVLPAHGLLNPTFLERFRREAKAAARLHHTNIVPVFGVGEDHGIHFYAMQFIQGQGLDQVLHDLRRLRKYAGTAVAAANATAEFQGSVAESLLTGKFETPSTERPPAPAATAEPRSSTGLSAGCSDSEYYRSVARVGLQAAEALAYAHRQGVLHRDVKPSNFLLDQQGTVWITDFGLAKAEGTDELTQTGDIVGTVRFMAPERFDGRSLPQSDVYGLGLTLYELLTLRSAFADTNKGRLIERVLREPPAPPRKLVPSIPRDLETVILKCVAKEPAERYATAEALADDLRRFLGDRPIHARRSSVRERLWRWCRRNPMVAGLLAGIVAVSLVGTAISVHFGIQATRRAEQAELAEHEGQEKLLQAHLAEARARRFSGQTGQRFASLAALAEAVELARRLDKPPGDFDEMRNLAIASLSLPDIHMVKEWDGWPAGSYGLAFDDQFATYARSDLEGNVTVRRMSDDGEIARRAGHGSKVSIGLDRDHMASCLILGDFADGFCQRWNFRTAEWTRLGTLPKSQLDVRGSCFSADGQCLVNLTQDGALDVFAWPSYRHLRTIRFGKWSKPGAALVGDFHWEAHPFEHRLAITLGVPADIDPKRLDAEHRMVRVVDLDNGTVVSEICKPAGDECSSVSWLPDGRTLAVGHWWTVVLWDVATRAPVRVFKDHKGGGLYAIANSTGEVVLSASLWAGGMKLWHPLTGRVLLSMPNQNVYCGYRADDGRLWSYFMDGTRLQLWMIDPARECRTLVRDPARGPVSDYRVNAIHPGGRLAAVGTDRGVTLLDLQTGLDVGHLNLGLNRSVTFDTATGDLLTYGRLGLFRWPVVRVENVPGSWRVGPPQRLPIAVRGLDHGIRLSADGRTLVAAQGDRATILHLDRLDRPMVLRPLEDVRQQMAISPDGQWVATGCHAGGGGDIRIWDPRDGKLIKSFGIEHAMNVCFSPDGKWLLTNDRSDYHFWHVGTWEAGPQSRVKAGVFQAHADAAFSPDSRLLAVERGDGAVRLIEVATGRELAALEDVQQGRSAQASFSPDGTQLLLTTKDCDVLRIWDLRKLRHGLKMLDLDWDAPPYPAEDSAPVAGPHRSLQIQIVGADQLPEPEKVAAALKLNNAAWCLATGPAEKRDPARALKLIEQAIKDDPTTPTYWNTLGVVQYRNGQYEQALVTLEKSLAAGQGQFDAFDLFFQAMCHAKLGDPVRAKGCFERAVTWCAKRPDLPAQHIAELATFRAEAQAVLGLK